MKTPPKKSIVHAERKEEFTKEGKNTSSDKRVMSAFDIMATWSRIPPKWRGYAGADKAAMDILRTSDPRLRDRAGLFIRISGFVILLLVLYLSIFGVFKENVVLVQAWSVVYFLYLTLLELARWVIKSYYDKPWFRTVRISINLIFVSWLLTISPDGRYLVGFLFVVPIFATIAYFHHKKWAILSVFIFSLVGSYLGGILFSKGNPLTMVQFGLIAMGLGFLSYGFYWFLSNTIFGSDILSNIAEQLYQTLDLHVLIANIIELSMHISRAERSLVIITDPENREYIDDIRCGFDLRDGISMADVAKKCIVLDTGEPFECPDMEAFFNNQNIYTKYFTCHPKSVLAIPLFDSAGRLLGVLNVAHDKRNYFNSVSKSLMFDLSHMVSNAVENCLTHRQVKLREAKGRIVNEELTEASSEKEIATILIDAIKQLIPKADHCVLHQFVPTTETLHPISPVQGGELTAWNWSPGKYANPPSSLEFGVGIAGHALKLKQSILVNDVDKHPWFVRTSSSTQIKSLLVAPLFDPSRSDLYGTLSISSQELGAFTYDDETSLVSLAHQGSSALVRVKSFAMWRGQGGIMKKIFDDIRDIPAGVSEDDLCSHMVRSATKLLGFHIARIRLLDSKGEHLVTKDVYGIPKKDAKKLIGNSIPFHILKPFFRKKYKAGQSYLIPDNNRQWRKVADNYFYIPPESFNKKTGWKAYTALLTPMFDQHGILIGLLTLDLPKTGTLHVQQVIEPIDVFASTWARAIEMARTQQRIEEQLRRQRSFIDAISAELAKGHDLQAVGEVVVQIGAKLFSAEGCNLYYLNDSVIKLTHSTYLSGTFYIGRSKPVTDHEKCGLAAWVASHGEVLLFNNEEFRSHPAWSGEADHLRYLPSKRCQSLLTAPIFNKDSKVVGVISLENKKTSKGFKDFDEDDKQRLVYLSNEFAKALETIGHYENIRQWERKGIEDDLHELINWYHSGVVAWVDAMDEWLQRDEMENVKKLMPDLRRHAHTTVDELKTIHTNMVSKCLEADNLKDALELMIEAWASRVIQKYEYGIELPIDLDCPDDLDLPVSVRNTLLRIIMEAFSNAILHSGILENPQISIVVKAQKSGDKIILVVSDTGKGVDPITPGYGVSRIQDLTRQLNGMGVQAQSVIESKLGRGTKVSVILQLEQ